MRELQHSEIRGVAGAMYEDPGIGTDQPRRNPQYLYLDAKQDRDDLTTVRVVSI